MTFNVIRRSSSLLIHLTCLFLIDCYSFTVHAEDGSRVGCGLLQPIQEDDELFALLYATTTPLSDDSTVTGNVLTVASLSSETDSILCYAGNGQGVEAGITSYLNNGTDCNVENGCGAHIHSGTSCNNSTTQGGHWYDSDTLEADPWATLGYLETTSDGTTMYGTCVNVGFPPAEAVDRPFIIHASDGSRVSCGMLTVEQGGDDATSSATREETRKACILFGFVVALVMAFW